MAGGYVPQEILDEIAAKCDIVSVISEYMPLKRTGANYQGLCPFHNEKTPSFSVSPGKQFFYCFGCGKGGNVFKFVMEIEGVSFIEAVRILARKAGVTLPERELSQAEKAALEQRKRYIQINEATTMFYQKVLWETKMGQPYRDYLEKRQISREIAEKFRLGANATGWNSLFEFLSKHNVSPKEMLDLGLISSGKKEGEYWDKFRARLMFPIANEKGDIIAFGGRIIDKQSAPQKYLNSQETPLFHKSRTVYGLNLAKSSIRNQDMALLVEGYMDVIACHQYGITNAVAALGTSFTPEQGKLLMRNTYQIGLSLDGDSAGQKATLRALDILQDLGCSPRVIRIPNNADPDEYLKEYGKEGFEKLIGNSQEAILYKLDRYMESENCDTMTGKYQVVRRLLSDLRRLPSAVARESAVHDISVKLQVSEKAIWDEIRFGGQKSEEKSMIASKNDEKNQNVGQEEEKKVANIENKAERVILRGIYEHPEFLSIVESYGGKTLFETAGADLYQDFTQSVSKCGKVDSSAVPPEKSELLAKLLMEESETADWEKSLRTAAWQLKQEQMNRQYRQLANELSEAVKLGEKDKMQDALAKMDQIRKMKNEFETGLKG